jgi:hypothetical protein
LPEHVLSHDMRACAIRTASLPIFCSFDATQLKVETQRSSCLILNQIPPFLIRFNLPHLGGYAFLMVSVRRMTAASDFVVQHRLSHKFYFISRTVSLNARLFSLLTLSRSFRSTCFIIYSSVQFVRFDSIGFIVGCR